MKAKYSFLISFIGFFIISSTTQAAVVRKTVNDSFLFVTPFFETLSEVDTELDIFEIPQGTEMELLSHTLYEYSDFIKVKLMDGSIGYIPAFAFSTVTITLSESGHIINLENKNKIPDGIYEVSMVGKWNYKNREESKSFHRRIVCPEKFLLKDKKGKAYDISDIKGYDDVRISEKTGNTYTVRNLKYFSEIMEYGEFQNTLDSLPLSESKTDHFYLTIDPNQQDLNAYVGCSRSYIESIFGEAYAYAGPTLSYIPGYTYAVYQTVIWKGTERGSTDSKNGGFVVYYDENLCARYFQKKLFTWTLVKWKDDAYPLVTPKHRVGAIDTELVSKLPKNGYYVTIGDGWVQQTEVVSKPVLSDRIRIGLMYFYDRLFNYANHLLLYLVILLFELIWAFAVIIWIRHIVNYGSNDWTNARCFLLMLPIVAYDAFYLWRFPFLFFLLGLIGVFMVMALPQSFLNNDISYRRCPSCHEYVEPIILNITEGMYHGELCHKDGPGLIIDNYGGSYGNRLAGGYSSVTDYKYRTQVTIRQDMGYDVRCPLCKHEWHQDKREDRPSVMGPILIERVHRNQSHSTVETKTTKTLSDAYGQVIDREERTDYDTSSSQNNYTESCHDYDRYDPYFKRYFKGDRDALLQYYKECWDDACWNVVQQAKYKSKK